MSFPAVGQRLAGDATLIHLTVVDKAGDDRHARGLGLCIRETCMQPYVVWKLINAPGGSIQAEEGSYCATLPAALKRYEARGGRLEKLGSPYGWIITSDELYPRLKHVDGAVDADGTVGPGGLSEAMELRLRRGEGQPFRMLDGDGIVYYQGRIILPPEDPPWPMEYDFMPLSDFGAPNAGCAQIDYLDAKGNWVPL